MYNDLQQLLYFSAENFSGFGHNQTIANAEIADRIASPATSGASCASKAPGRN
jgi:hypothetical protein